MSHVDYINTEHGRFYGNEETGQTAQEVYDTWLMRDLQPSAQELADADLEIKMIILLMKMEVI